MPDINTRKKFSKLLKSLHTLKFYFTIPLDENRKVDGLKLRCRFGYENNIDKNVISSSLDSKECSMLEMMVALALRGEEHIMSDPDIGDRLDSWFFEMLKSLKLHQMTNDIFDYDWVESRIDILLKHEYEPNGHGGLFTLSNPRADMRKAEIWYQMCWYLDAILKE